MIKLSRWLACGLFVLVVAQVGCDKGPAEPKRGKVTGVVTFKDEPVEGASVTFMAAGASISAGAKTDKDGKYSVDAVVGKNTVTISKVEGGEEAKISEADMKKGNMVDAFKGKVGEKPKNALPEKYGSVADSQLSVDVQEGKTTTQDFPLKE